MMQSTSWKLPFWFTAFLLAAGCGPTSIAEGGGEAPSPAPAVSPTPASPFLEAAECDSLAPETLPDGTRPDEGRPFPEEGPLDFYRAWGEGNNEVVIGWGRDVLEETGGLDAYNPFLPKDWPEELVVTVEGSDRYVVPIGDEGVGEVSIRFSIDACPYILWLPGANGTGYTSEEVVEYAERF